MKKDTLEALANIVGQDHCLTDDGAVAPFVNDWRRLYRGRALAVLLPGSVAEVRAIIALSREQGLAIVPQGGNTGLAGAATPDDSGRAIVVSLRRLNRIRGVDPANNSIEVEAGCLLVQVQDAAAAAGRFFPLSLGAEGSCTIGGNLATNAGGINVLKYGTARDLVLGIEVVLPDGNLLGDIKTLRKDNTGYDLKQLFIGSEGTLGIITAATLTLFPRLERRATAIAALASLDAAPGLLARLRAGTDDRVVSFELLPRLGFELARLVHPDLIEIFGSPPDHAILMELASSSSTTDLAALLEDCLAGALTAGEITDATIAQSGAQAAGLWRWREGMVDGQYRRGPGIKHDISVPVASTPAFIVRAGAILARRHPELEALAFGHLGDGNIHYNLLQKPGTAELNLEAVTPIVNKLVHDLALEMGGSISAEHGIGQLRRSEFARRADPIELSLMRGLKSLLDPDGLMNPGKVL